MLPVLSHYSQYIYFALFFIATLGALWRGGEVERAVAAVFIYGLVVQMVGAAVVQPKFFEIDEITLLVDAIYCGSLVWIALFANRTWTLWAAGIQMLSLIFHLPRGLMTYIGEQTYAYLYVVPTGVALLVLAVGLIFHSIRRAKHGEYRQWRATGLDIVPQTAEGRHMRGVYESDLEGVLARGWLEYLILSVGALVTLYAISALIYLVDDTRALYGAIALLLIGLGTLIFGVHWRHREDRAYDERKAAFAERWGKVRLNPVLTDQVGSPTLN